MKKFSWLAGATLVLSLWSSPSWAADPFRSTNPHAISNNTEQVFNVLFKQGNYVHTKELIDRFIAQGETDPLLYAMRACLAYTDQDSNALNTYAQKTITMAQNWVEKDNLRGNLYLAVGNALDAAYTFQNEGAVPALPKLQKAFQYLDEVDKISEDDPEVNLIKGYMDLMLAIYLPFSSPDQAIERFESYASPSYLVDRGIAIAYRDLKDYDQALTYVEKALSATPENPEILYLKAQILYKQGRTTANKELLKQSLALFDQAIAKSEQLPARMARNIRWERNQTDTKIQELGG